MFVHIITFTANDAYYFTLFLKQVAEVNMSDCVNFHKDPFTDEIKKSIE